MRYQAVAFSFLLLFSSNVFAQHRPLFTLYLIGDTGLTASDSSSVGFLSRELQGSSNQDNTAVVFLGDNIYKYGWRVKGKATVRNFNADSLIISSQLQLLKGYNGYVYFVPRKS